MKHMVPATPMGRLAFSTKLALIALTLWVSACSGSGTTQPSSSSVDQTLRVGLAFLNQPPDPVRAGLQSVRTGIAETLFRLNRKLQPEPWLATGARRVDATTWEITLRQGVRFHDGAPMDAAAVKASIERAITRGPVAKALLDIVRAETKDGQTVWIQTAAPSPNLPGLLSEPTTAIVNAAAAEAMGDAFLERPVLTGPYRVERFQTDRELVVVRHEQYWGPQPQLERVIFSYLPDSNTRMLALQSGDIDIADYVAPESVPVLRNNPRLAVRAGEPIALEFLMLNHRREPWRDARVRRAIAMAIDRETLGRAVLRGQGSPAGGPIPPALLRCTQLQALPFHVQQARQLLGQAGYLDRDAEGYLTKHGQTLGMTLVTYRQRPELPVIAEAVQASLKTIGIKVTIRLVESIEPALRGGDWDAATYFNNMVSTGDPYWALSQFFATGGSVNHGGYSNPRADALIRELGITDGRASRDRLACTASEDIVQDAALVPLLYPFYNYGVAQTVAGFDDPHPFQMYLLDSNLARR